MLKEEQYFGLSSCIVCWKRLINVLRFEATGTVQWRFAVLFILDSHRTIYLTFGRSINYVRLSVPHKSFLRFTHCNFCPKVCNGISKEIVKCFLNFRFQLDLATLLRTLALMTVISFLCHMYNALCSSLQESSKIFCNTTTFAVHTAMHSYSAKFGTCHQSYGKTWRGVLHWRRNWITTSNCRLIIFQHKHWQAE